jgi:hypothetical protein
MNENLIKKIGQWAAYIGAIANWFADSLTSFPARSKFFTSVKNKIDSESKGVL